MSSTGIQRYILENMQETLLQREHSTHYASFTCYRDQHLSQRCHPMPLAGKMRRIFSFEAGNTLGCHEEFLRKLIMKGAKVVDSDEKSNAIIIFCPIVSRYETDINSALSSLPGGPDIGLDKTVILVAMHHTFDEDYTLPNHREQGYHKNVFLVDCLFFETKGLWKCPCNKKAVKMVRKKLQLKKWSPHGLLKAKEYKKVGDKKKD
ncbi:hypothetical protein FQN60_003240 [Etheostoma spectabile]|uniref:Uncharacterized protein n=1 Tax=Etheostoma spectabile TaxID=54343 RepID=A0A5J5CLM3_9PERO|nr:hypothetical protein FQN60_003240 [Etheostoma spectabile]